MAARRWTYRTLPSELRDTSRWRQVDTSLLEEEEVILLERMQRAIEGYLGTGRLRSVAKEARASPEEVLRRLNRCLSYGADGSILGWAGLLSGRITRYQRAAELPSGRPGAARGFVGAFAAFLGEHPAIKEKLDSLILKRNKRGVVYESQISAKTLHTTLIRLCEEEGLTREQYPLNSKSQGRRSVERYMHDLVASNVTEGTRAKFGAAAAARLRLGTGAPRRIQYMAPFDLVALDAHKIDCIGTVRINGPAGPQWVAVSRLWLVVVLEQALRLILGYSIGIRAECSSATIESALKSALNRWEPRNLRIPGMEY